MGPQGIYFLWKMQPPESRKKCGFGLLRKYLKYVQFSDTCDTVSPQNFWQKSLSYIMEQSLKPFFYYHKYT